MADAVAANTCHGVLWGGHGYGFDRLDPIFPVVTRPLPETLARYRMDLVAWDARHWPEGESVLRHDGLIASVEPFGSWCLAEILACPSCPPHKVMIITAGVALTPAEPGRF